MQNVYGTKQLFLPIVVLLVILTPLLSYFALSHSSTPFVWIFILCGVLFLFFSYNSKQWLKVVSFNISIFSFLLVLTELYAYSLSQKTQRIGKEVKFTSSQNKDFYYRHPLLGFAPSADNIVKHHETYDNGETLEVTYTIDKNGLRATLPVELEEKTYDEAVLFFGCSFTFGEAVNDNETLPYFYGKYIDWKFKIYNFGFLGWGPNQMLAALENGIVSNIVAERPKLIVFQGILDHVNRVNKGLSWIKYGPRYIIENNKLIHSGQFKDEDKPKNNLLSLKEQLYKSFLVVRLKHLIYQTVLASRKTSQIENNSELFLRIITESQEKAKSLFPDAKFIVVLWGNNRHQRYLVNELRKREVTVHEVRKILPDYETNKEKYFVKNNGHPSRHAFDKIAEYISQNVSLLDY